MPLSTLIIIALRLFAIYWLAEGISTFVSTVPIIILFCEKLGFDSKYPIGALQISEYLGIPLVMFVMAAVLWGLAAKISAKVVEGHETTVAFSALMKADLYHFAFVFLGLYFALSSVNNIVYAGYQLLTQDAMLPESDPRRGRELAPFFGHALTLLIGLGCVLGASKWTRILLKREQSNEKSRNLPD